MVGIVLVVPVLRRGVWAPYSLLMVEATAMELESQ